MTWLVTETAFELVVGEEAACLHGYTHRHEWLAYGEALVSEERSRIASLPMMWEICPKGLGRIAHYLGLSGQMDQDASTVVRVPSDAVIVLAEVGEPRWSTLLRAFEQFSAATYPKHFRLNIPFESLSTRGERTIPLQQFLSGEWANASAEELSAVFFFGTQAPEAEH